MRKGFAYFLTMSFLLALLGPVSGHAQDQQGGNFQGVRRVELWSPQLQQGLRIAPANTLFALVLFSPECPMCINYTQTLNAIQQQYGEKIQLIGIVPGKTYADSTLLNCIESYSLNFPLYVDRNMKLSRYLKGEVTPEVFLFGVDGQKLYHGAIDNWLLGLGQKKQKPDQHYLLNAIEQTLAGETVTLPHIKAQGCILNDY
jgi:hypothetical protein